MVIKMCFELVGNGRSHCVDDVGFGWCWAESKQTYPATLRPPSKTCACARMPRSPLPSSHAWEGGSVAAWRVAIAGLRSVEWGRCFSGQRDPCGRTLDPCQPLTPSGDPYPPPSLQHHHQRQQTVTYRCFQVPDEIMLLTVSNLNGQSTDFPFVYKSLQFLPYHHEQHGTDHPSRSTYAHPSGNGIAQGIGCSSVGRLSPLLRSGFLPLSPSKLRSTFRPGLDQFNCPNFGIA
jgi:hypothetical protein